MVPSMRALRVAVGRSVRSSNRGGFTGHSPDPVLIETLETRRLLAAWSFDPGVDLPENDNIPSIEELQMPVDDGEILPQTCFVTGVETTDVEPVAIQIADSVTLDDFNGWGATTIIVDENGILGATVDGTLYDVTWDENNVILINGVATGYTLDHDETGWTLNQVQESEQTELDPVTLWGGEVQSFGGTYVGITNAAGEVVELYEITVHGVGFACILLAPYRVQEGPEETLSSLGVSLEVGESITAMYPRDFGKPIVVDQVDVNAPAGTSWSTYTRVAEVRPEFAAMWPDVAETLRPTPSEPVDIVVGETIEVTSVATSVPQVDVLEAALPAITVQQSHTPLGFFFSTTGILDRSDESEVLA